MNCVLGLWSGDDRAAGQRPGLDVAAVVEAVLGARLLFNDERELQGCVGAALRAAGISFEAEYRANRRDVFDFWLPDLGLVLETKVWGSNAQLLRQLKRYADLEEVAAIAVIDRRRRELPRTLSGKPILAVPIWKNLIA